jgi:tetratricopeptide (TPR) repeat protein
MRLLGRTALISIAGMYSLLNLSFCFGQHQHPPPEKLGVVAFSVSCSPSVQTSFNHAVALLHSFAYASAEREFLEIAKSDPQCAMARWGVAMCYYHQLWEPPVPASGLQRGQAETQEAQRLSLGLSPREQGFVDALAVFYRHPDRNSYRERSLAYVQAMGALASHNPNDSECQIFYALALLSTASSFDRSRANQKQAAEILEPLFRKYPRHPGVAHYLIHAYDSPELARQGLPAAREYAKIAPSAPHALHMPSHIFTLLGLWPDSIQSNSAARVAAHRQGDVGEELHSMDYLMYAYLQAGRYEDATKLLAELRQMPELPVPEFKVGYAATIMPVREAVERQRWDDAMAISQRRGSPPQVLAIVEWATAVGAARTGKLQLAELHIQSLKDLLLQVQKAGDDYWASQVEIEIHEAKAWLARANGQHEEALSLLRSAATQEDNLAKHPITPGPVVPAREQLASLLLELHQPAQALSEFEASLERTPGRRGALSGAVRAAELSGNQSKAMLFKSELSKLNGHSSTN